MTDELYIGNDEDGSSQGLIRGITTAFAWADWRKPRNTSVKMTSLRAEI
jgi:hypothetical protein